MKTMSTKNKSPELFSISAAATKLKRTRRTIERAIENIKPASVAGGLKKWTLKQLVDGLNENINAPVTKGGKAEQPATGGLAAQRARLARAQAEAAEHKNRIASGQFFPAQVIVEVFETANSVVRERMLAVPSCASEIASLISPTQEEIYEIIKREIYAGLTELSDPEYFQKSGEKFHPLASYKEGDDPGDAK
jgi:phage terminase Nu1 subunit (DNA packaging protein)